MTLATLPRYRRDAVDRSDGHAVVVGASVAGLLAARVLSDAFETVTLLERDSLADEPGARRGTPQADHVHVLLEAGRATMTDFFPGFEETLLSAGGLSIDESRDLSYYQEGDFVTEASPSTAFSPRAVARDWLSGTSTRPGRSSTSSGRSPSGRTFDRYLGRVIRRAHDDRRVATAFGRVLRLERPPTHLLRPETAARVLLPRRPVVLGDRIRTP